MICQISAVQFQKGRFTAAPDTGNYLYQFRRIPKRDESLKVKIPVEHILSIVKKK
jgi:hypothetical protein